MSKLKKAYKAKILCEALISYQLSVFYLFVKKLTFLIILNAEVYILIIKQKIHYNQ